jgi:hypothetical protein
VPPKKTNPFPLRSFRGVNMEYVHALELAGIKNTEQLLEMGQTAELRAVLSEKTCIPVEAVVEMVRLSDLARLPGVKGIRARLYYDAGVDSVEKMSEWEPEALRVMLADYVERTGFDGIAPLPKEVSSTIANARRLPHFMQW